MEQTNADPERSRAQAQPDPDPPANPCQPDTESADLAASWAGLARLSTARLSLEDLLTQVAGFAVQAIPGADGAGLTLHETDHADTVVWNAPCVNKIDGIQYRIGEGPCITAAATGRTMRSGSLGRTIGGRDSARGPAVWGSAVCCPSRYKWMGQWSG